MPRLAHAAHGQRVGGGGAGHGVKLVQPALELEEPPVVHLRRAAQRACVRACVRVSSHARVCDQSRCLLSCSAPPPSPPAPPTGGRLCFRYIFLDYILVKTDQNIWPWLRRRQVRPALRLFPCRPGRRLRPVALVRTLEKRRRGPVAVRRERGGAAVGWEQGGRGGGGGAGWLRMTRGTKIDPSRRRHSWANGGAAGGPLLDRPSPVFRVCSGTHTQ